MKRYLYEPGNGTRYELVIARIEGETTFRVKQGYLVVGPFPDALRAFTIAEGMSLHWTYVGEKLKLNEVDASVVTYMLGEALGITAWPSDSEDYTRGIKKPFQVETHA